MNTLKLFFFSLFSVVCFSAWGAGSYKGSWLYKIQHSCSGSDSQWRFAIGTGNDEAEAGYDAFRVADEACTPGEVGPGQVEAKVIRRILPASSKAAIAYNFAFCSNCTTVYLIKPLVDSDPVPTGVCLAGGEHDPWHGIKTYGLLTKFEPLSRPNENTDCALRGWYACSLCAAVFWAKDDGTDYGRCPAAGSPGARGPHQFDPMPLTELYVVYGGDGSQTDSNQKIDFKGGMKRCGACNVLYLDSPNSRCCASPTPGGQHNPRFGMQFSLILAQ